MRSRLGPRRPDHHLALDHHARPRRGQRAPAGSLGEWRLFAAAGDAGRGALRADLLALIGRFNRADNGIMVVPGEYLEAVIVRRSSAVSMNVRRLRLVQAGVNPVPWA